MNVSEIRAKAEKLGIKKARQYKKADLIHEIQKTEGNQQCYQVSGDSCMEFECCWRTDCLKPK